MRARAARGRSLACALALVCAAGCNSTRVATCPGDRVGTFTFQGELVAGDGGTCPFATDAGLAFRATVAWTGDTTAAFCLERADAPPLLGSRDGGHVAVVAATTPANTPCTCGVDVTEAIEGDLVAGGAGVGFTGELTDVFTVRDPVDGGGCEPAPSLDGGAACGAPCAIQWRLTGTR